MSPAHTIDSPVCGACKGAGATGNAGCGDCQGYGRIPTPDQVAAYQDSLATICAHKLEQGILPTAEERAAYDQRVSRRRKPAADAQDAK